MGGLDPSILLNIIAYEDNSEKYIVIEGNRRVTALKIIKDIEMIKDSKHYQKFKTLISKYDVSNIPDEYLCIYYFEKSDAQFWIYLRHSGELKGEDLVPWDTLATQRFKVATGQEKADISYCVNNYLKEKKDTRLPQKTSTTLKRILNTSHGKAYYGLSADNNVLKFGYDEENTVLKLMLLLEYLDGGTINSRNANNTLEIQNWIMKLDNLYKAKYEPSQEYATAESNEDTEPTSTGTNSNPGYATKTYQTTTPPPQKEQQNKNNQGEGNNNKQESDSSKAIATQTTKGKEGNSDSKNEKTSSTNNSSPKKIKFMNGLIYIHLDPKENKGIINLCDELVKLSTSNYKDYSTYPIASGMLLRSLIEQSFKYHLKKPANKKSIGN